MAVGVFSQMSPPVDDGIAPVEPRVSPGFVFKTMKAALWEKLDGGPEPSIVVSSLAFEGAFAFTVVRPRESPTQSSTQ